MSSSSEKEPTISFCASRMIGTLHTPESEEELLKIVENFIWVSYRDGFTYRGMPMADTGWGCMIRVGQMAVANALLRLGIGRSEVIKQFLDDYCGSDAPFSIKNILNIGSTLVGKQAGEWYGAHSISQVINYLNVEENKSSDMETVIFNDGMIYKDEILEKVAEKATLVMIPLRIGLNKIEESYLI